MEQQQQHPQVAALRHQQQQHLHLQQQQQHLPLQQQSQLSCEAAMSTMLSYLREENLRLLRENDELRDLCCFLDDDRQKAKRVARQWQAFGRTSASTMRQEVAAYHSKLKALERRQADLARDNEVLKQLCIDIDHDARDNNNACANCGAEQPTSQKGTTASGSSPSTSRTSAMSTSADESGDCGDGGRTASAASSHDAISVFRIYDEANAEMCVDYEAEKALLQEMCNVVFRAISHTGAQ